MQSFPFHSVIKNKCVCAYAQTLSKNLFILMGDRKRGKNKTKEKHFWNRKEEGEDETGGWRAEWLVFVSFHPHPADTSDGMVTATDRLGQHTGEYDANQLFHRREKYFHSNYNSNWHFIKTDITWMKAMPTPMPAKTPALCSTKSVNLGTHPSW